MPMDICDIEKLIDLYGNVIYGFCRRLTMNKSDADDLYQQTFLRALEIKEKIDINNNPKGFLISLAVSIWKNSTRKKARHYRIAPIVGVEEDDWLNTSTDSISIEDIVISNELTDEVNTIVSKLNDKFRIPIIMYYNGNMSIAEIATALQVPQGTIKSRLYKARLIIKNELEVKGYERYR